MFNAFQNSLSRLADKSGIGESTFELQGFDYNDRYEPQFIQPLGTFHSHGKSSISKELELIEPSGGLRIEIRNTGSE